MNKPFWVITAITYSLLVPSLSWANPSLEAMAEQISSNGAVVNPAPVFSADHSLSTEQAYQIQTMAVKSRLGNIAPQALRLA
ncbi:hypothetical protein [Oceanicoccus sagamiensis]|uniref:Uncharacterized protein n=1 Tax=Oceanicoccus sagamiensis TaxID=716816 RepID=A0A1X9NCE6_9GAMM|nr:hypothetical protein [Oceanicoccus sagamiensis]ARN73209.1 hypothetical protein BST96_03260 [Oceanicoccus sagamiensis]